MFVTGKKMFLAILFSFLRSLQYSYRMDTFGTGVGLIEGELMRRTITLRMTDKATISAQTRKQIPIRGNEWPKNSASIFQGFVF